MAETRDKEEPWLILGAGTFGLATALSLALAGHKNITVLERDEQIPSRFSAGFDLNKIARAEYADPFYTSIALKAIRKWQTDPLYQPHFRQVGFLNVVSGTASATIRGALDKYFASISNNPEFNNMVVSCQDGDSIKSVLPYYSGALTGWKGYLNRLAGYTHSFNAMKAVYDECVKAGVVFKTGVAEGEVVELIYAPGSKMCLGAKTRNNNTYRAHKTILALGAGVGGLLPSIGQQVVGRCWGVAHIQLEPTEAAKLRGMPVTNVRDIGFFFEPDLATNKLKICHMGGGYTNHSSSPTGISLPYPQLEDSGFITNEDEQQMRRLLRESLPQFADRPLIDTHLCWFADTSDSDFIIDFVPESDGSLVVLSGDSGHGFKMLPIFGDMVQELLQRGSQEVPKWRWKDNRPQSSPTQVVWRASGSQELAVARAKL